ncbi:MAG: C4-dicarboxylate ABC transporter permease [Oceanospirillaceae bacterium]|nr:C4-dicarboxylate ABC transporter permease [Oceanospirillaceae bacterium]MBT6101409.1 C4-dicarboxylate ABC transporter permease [Oceanospirillaceae bacterium]MBT7673416.1 C4-dicarboxylate ABC transporter permease [Oceanospirillaceae bacterium]MDB9905802.1 tripartite tricarboxylate transporter permease [Oceanospirillaceae bacterium]MDO7573729.1 tripartite tricarboxylate transporter permease [Oceanospirillaceae bacterium]
MEIFDHIGAIFSISNLLVLVIATTGGLILGALPGLSPTMAVALLIPFTFQMDAATGLVLLGAVYTATVAGGAISGILVNIPGAPANIATVLDGHPMAKKGKATQALHFCFISSFVGGITGVLVLIFFTPPLAKLALKFGPSEMFWMAIVGVTVIGTLGSKSVVKGLFSGVLGLWISTIGISPIFGESRFVFTDHLTGGVHIVVALIGLFAVPQIYQLLVTSRQTSSGGLFTTEDTPLWSSIKYNLSRVKALAIGTISGVVVGIIPGAGGQIAGLVAYDQVRKFSPDASKFGHGEPDGVIAAESANNAMVGPSLVPLLTLGIPGSPTAAVLLGGLLINGLFPGPDLFTVHAAVTWTFIGSLLLAQILMLVIGLGLSRSSSNWVMRVPSQYMAAAVTILAVFGTYSIQNSYSDVVLMLVLGSLMYVLNKYGFSAAPIVLGIILGPIAEDNFSMGKMIADVSDGPLVYFMTGSINLVLIVVCLVSIGYSIWVEVKQRRKVADDLKRSMPGSRVAAVGAVMVSVLVLMMVLSANGSTAYDFPFLLAILLMVFAVVLFIDVLRVWDRQKSNGVLVEWPDLGAGIAIILGYLLVMPTIGFYLASWLGFNCIVLFYSAKKDRQQFTKTLWVSLCFIGVIYLLFSVSLRVVTPGWW